VAAPNTRVFFARGTVELIESTTRSPVAAKGRTNARKVQCHQGATSEQGKGFIAAPSHKI